MLLLQAPTVDATENRGASRSLHCPCGGDVRLERFWDMGRAERWDRDIEAGGRGP